MSQGAEGVCRLLGTCEKNHNLCLVMKRYESSLADVISRGPLPGAEIRRISHSLFRTLEQLHRAGVIVQDIKPQNILLDQYGSPVFADFGIAVVVGRTTKFMPSSMKGTFNYMPPEAFEPPLSIMAGGSTQRNQVCVQPLMHTHTARTHAYSGMQARTHR